MDNFILEKKIKETLKKEAEKAGADAFAAQRIRANVYSRMKEAEHMKKRNWKRTAMVAAAICVLGSMTALGLGRATMITGGSSAADAIKTYAAAEAKQESLDKQVKMIEKFSNGYAFKEAVPVDETASDENGNVVGKETTLHVVYAKDGADDLHVFSGRLSLGGSENADIVKELEDGTKLAYTSLVNKLVAESYVISDEEKALQEAGKLNIAYDGRTGTEVDINTSYHVTWVQDGITYSMLTRDGDMTAEEMLGMAQEIAESE